MYETPFGEEEQGEKGGGRKLLLRQQIFECYDIVCHEFSQL